jgi:hypothetical protein
VRVGVSWLLLFQVKLLRGKSRSNIRLYILPLVLMLRLCFWLWIHLEIIPRFSGDHFGILVSMMILFFKFVVGVITLSLFDLLIYAFLGEIALVDIGIYASV